MKKNYFFGALMSLMLVLFALPVKAQVTSITDLYGTYQFTADVTVADIEGKDTYAKYYSNDCEVVITSDPNANYDAQIFGLAGGNEGGVHYVNKFDASANQMLVYNWNNSNVLIWGGGLHMSNTEGIYPFGWGDMPQLGNYVLTYDPETKNITLDDFTLVTVSGTTATVVATFTNVKLTFKEAEEVEEIEVADLSGEWHAKAGAGNYSCNPESSIPTEYDFVLTKTGEDNKNYNADITIEGFSTVTLPATFDGTTLTIEVKNVVFDNAGHYVSYYNGATEYDVTFNYTSEGKLKMGAPLVVGTAEPTTDENGEPATKYSMEQWYMDGMAQRVSDEDETAFDWAGTWIVKGTEAVANVPVEFEMVVDYYEAIDAYYISKFSGYDVANLNNGGFRLTPSADGKTAEIATGGLLKSVVQGEIYLKLYDLNLSANPIMVTVNEDGTISIADYTVVEGAYDAAPDPAGMKEYYVGLTGAKKAEPEVEAFDWAGTWTVKAGKVEAYDGKEYPSEFEMVVEYDAENDMYFVTKFMGNDVSGLNWGGILLTPSADNKSAELETGKYVGGAYPEYLMIYDMNATTSPVAITVNEDGTLSIANFFVKTLNYDTNEETRAVYYQEVTASKPGEGGEKPEVEPFDWAGTWTVKAGKVEAYDGKEYPSEFEMVVEYDAENDMYFVTKFMGNDVSGLNWGGILLTPSADNKSAELETGKYVGGAYPDYLKIYDMNATTSPVILTMNEDGTISIANFFVKALNYDTNEETDAVYYQNVTATKGANSIESVKNEDAQVSVNGGVITIAGGAQAVQVYDAAGRLEFSGVASSVANLSKGIHIVKVGAATVKVAVK